MTAFLLVKILSVLVASISQIMLKKSANHSYENVLKEYLNPLVIFSYVLMIISMLMGIYSLNGIKIAYSVVIESISYILVPTLSFIFFKERINSKQVFSILIILIGVIIYGI